MVKKIFWPFFLSNTACLAPTLNDYIAAKAYYDDNLQKVRALQRQLVCSSMKMNEKIEELKNQVVVRSLKRSHSEGSHLFIHFH
jgi:hypothetical protein